MTFRRIVDFVTTRFLLVYTAYRLQKAPVPVFLEADPPPSESWFPSFLRGIAPVFWATVFKALISSLPSIIVYFYRQVVIAQLQRFGEQWNAGPPAIEAAIEAPRDLVPVEQALPARTTSPKKARSSWTYKRGLYMTTTFFRAIVTSSACRGRTRVRRTLPG